MRHKEVECERENDCERPEVSSKLIPTPAPSSNPAGMHLAVIV